MNRCEMFPTSNICHRHNLRAAPLVERLVSVHADPRNPCWIDTTVPSIVRDAAMTALFPAQRAAEEFDRVLGGTASRAVADRHAELLSTVEVLRTQPEVMPRTEFVEDLRAPSDGGCRDRARRRTRRRCGRCRHPARRTRDRNRRAGTVAAALVIVGGTAGMAAAAAGALPGESLYPIKRGGEQVGTAVRFGEASKGRSMLGQAETRLDEVARADRRGHRLT